VPRKSSKDLLKKVVEETLAEYGGEPVKNAVIFYLTKMHGIRPEDILQKPEVFVKALNDIYGPFEKIIENEFRRSRKDILNFYFFLFLMNILS